MSSDMRTSLLDALGRYDVPPGPERVNFTFAFAAGWNAAATEARADSAVPSSHVSACHGLDTPERVRFYEYAYHWEKFKPSDRAGGEGVQASPPATTEQAWVHPRRAWFDKLDDGHGPYMEHEVIPLPMTDAAPSLWTEFKEWFARDFGQGYSLACADGTILDTVTAWAFRAFRAGRRHAAVHHGAPETDHPKAEGESILREALALVREAQRYVDGYLAALEQSGVGTVDRYRAIAKWQEAARSALAGIPLNASGDPTERSG